MAPVNQGLSGSNNSMLDARLVATPNIQLRSANDAKTNLEPLTD